MDIASPIAPTIASASIMAVPAAVHAVIAEVVPGPLPDWIGSFTQISAFGLVAWIVYYMFSKWLPDLQAAAAAQLRDQREAHSQAIKTIADAHQAAVQAMTKSFAETLQAQRSDLLALAKSETHPH